MALLQNSWKNKFIIQYRCIAHAGVGDVVSQVSTPCSDIGNNFTDSLAKHNIECLPGFGLQSFQLQKCDAKTFKFNFTCVKANVAACQKYESNTADSSAPGGNKETSFLDRLYVQVNPKNGDDILTRFQYQIKGSTANFAVGECKLVKPCTPEVSVKGDINNATTGVKIAYTTLTSGNIKIVFKKEGKEDKIATINQDSTYSIKLKEGKYTRSSSLNGFSVTETVVTISKENWSSSLSSYPITSDRRMEICSYLGGSTTRLRFSPYFTKW